MTGVVENIASALSKVMAQKLGAGFQLLKYVYEIEKNSKRSKERGYGVTPGDMETVDGMSRHYTVEQAFNLVIMDRYEDRNDESRKKEAIFNLYERAEKIIENIYLGNLGVSEVINMASFAIAEPEILSEESAVVLRIEIRVQWRKRMKWE